MPWGKWQPWCHGLFHCSHDLLGFSLWCAIPCRVWYNCPHSTLFSHHYSIQFIAFFCFCSLPGHIIGQKNPCRCSLLLNSPAYYFSVSCMHMHLCLWVTLRGFETQRHCQFWMYDTSSQNRICPICLEIILISTSCQQSGLWQSPLLQSSGKHHIQVICVPCWHISQQKSLYSSNKLKV